MRDGSTGDAWFDRRPFADDAELTAPAAGFVSTVGDLARFFAQLMTRPQWRNPDSSLERTYGLGTMSGGKGDWWWFGHGGAFQGFISHTAALPVHGIGISLVTNAIDGYANQWMAGALALLATFARHGAPSERVRDWSGRWWSIWSTTDLVPMGDKVLVANPALATPFADASEIAVSGPDEGTLVKANGFGSHGETVRRRRDGDGRVHELRLAGGTLVPEARVAAELTARDLPARSSP